MSYLVFDVVELEPGLQLEAEGGHGGNLGGPAIYVHEKVRNLFWVTGKKFDLLYLPLIYIASYRLSK